MPRNTKEIDESRLFRSLDLVVAPWPTYFIGNLLRTESLNASPKDRQGRLPEAADSTRAPRGWRRLVPSCQGRQEDRRPLQQLGIPILARWQGALGMHR